MKKFFLALSFGLLFFGCGKNYEENNTVIFNKTNNDVTISVDNKILVAKARSTDVGSAILGYFSDTPIVNFLDQGVHLKSTQSWYYSGGSSYHSITIEEQKLQKFIFNYYGGKKVYLTNDRFKTDDGKMKKLLLTLGTAPEDGTKYYTDENGNNLIYAIHNAYESEILASLWWWYTIKETATPEEIKSFEESDYIDLDEMPYLNFYVCRVKAQPLLDCYEAFMDIAPLD